MEQKEFTITVFTENQTGLLLRVVAAFTKRHINIESLTTSKSSMEGIHRFTIVCHVTEETVIKLTAQLEKAIDVLKAYYYCNDEIVAQEVALYKVPITAFMGSNKLEALVRSHNARILEIETEFIVIEKTGHAEETEALLDSLKAFTKVYEFVRSGKVAIVRPMERLNKYLKKIEAHTAASN